MIKLVLRYCKILKWNYKINNKKYLKKISIK